MKKIKFKESFKNKKIIIFYSSLLVIMILSIAVIINNSYALWNINLNQNSVNHLIVKDSKQPTIKKVEDNQNTELWKYKDSVTKIVFENTIHQVTGEIESYDIASKVESGTYKVMAKIVANDDNLTHTVYIQAVKNIYLNQDSSNLFANFTKLEMVEGLEYLNSENVISMYNMFLGCNSLKTLDLSSFITSKVTIMAGMFYHCENLTSLNLTTFDTSNVVTMNRMFDSCRSLEYLDLSSFDTKNVSDMEALFYECNNLKNINLDNFNMASLTIARAMFYNCNKINVVINVNSSSTALVEYEGIFYNAATDNGEIIVNYNSETSSLVDEMLTTKSESSNVVKGAELTV